MNARQARLAAALLGSLPIAIFGLVPLLALTSRAELASIDVDRLLRTTRLALLATTLALAIGVPAGLALARLRGRLWLARALLLLPLIAPPVMIAQGWTTAARPGGVVSRFVAACGGSPAAMIDALESLGGAAFVLATCLAPIVALLVEAAIASVPTASFDAARSLGASEWRTFRVAAGLTLVRAVFGASCLAFVLAAGECGAPTLLDVDVLGHEVLVHLAAFPDFGAATAAAWPLMLLGMLAFALTRATRRSAEIRDDALAPSSRDSTPTRGATVVLLLVLLSFVAPPYGSWFAAARASDLELAFDLAKSPLVATLVSGFVVAAIATLCGGALASAEFAVANDPPKRVSRALAWIAIGVFATPSVLLGLGVSALPILARHSDLALFGVLVARHVAVAWLLLAPRVAALPRERIESAFALGASPLRVVGRIVTPALVPSLLASFLLGFVLAAQDLGATALLHSPGRETLSVALLSIEANSPRGVVAAFSLIGAGCLVAIAALAFLALRHTTTRGGEKNRSSLNPDARSAGLLR